MRAQNLPRERQVGKSVFVPGGRPQGGCAKGGRVVSRVLFVYRGRRMVIYLGRPSPDASSSLPTARAVRVAPRRLFGLAPIGGYPATAVASGAVGSYPTFSPLPTEVGGMFSVALSVALRRPGVTWQSTLWSSDFPRGPKTPRPPHPTPSHQEDNAHRRSRKEPPLALAGFSGQLSQALFRTAPESVERIRG